MLIKWLIGVAFLVILYCLGSSAYFLSKRDRSQSLAKALTWRMLLSLLLFVFLFVAYYFGWLVPHGIL